MSLTLRGRRVNGLPVRTLCTIIAILNMARHGNGVYVEIGLSHLARNLSDSGWGGCWWYGVRVYPPGPSRPMVPKGAWLS